mgnify:FL=1
MNPLDFLISPAHAQAAAPAAASGLGTMLLPALVIIAMLFFMTRQQSRRAKDHKAMLDKLAKGDEVITTGGIAGVVREIGDSFVSVEVADNVRVRVQKGAIGHVLPKGTLKSS